MGFDLGSTAEAVTVLGFAGGVGAWVNRSLGKVRHHHEDDEREKQEAEAHRENWEGDVDAALFGANADPRRGIPKRKGLIEQMGDVSDQMTANTAATRELTSEVASLHDLRGPNG